MQALFFSAALYFLALFISLSAGAQSNPNNQPPANIANITHDHSLDSFPRETFVPFTRQGNLILVKGAVNGKSVTMVFDTGAGGCLFSLETLRSLGVKIPAK